MLDISYFNTKLKSNHSIGCVKMKIRINMLWRVPVFCILASWISFYLTIYLGRFFFIQEIEQTWSANPVRLFIFNAMLFIIILLIGGLGVFKTMTRLEIAVSATITSCIYFSLTVLQHYLFEFFISSQLWNVQHWPNLIYSIYFHLTNNVYMSVALGNLSPFLFVLFGKKAISSTDEIK